jgi:hypothetical protein
VSGFCAAVLHSSVEAAKGEPSPGREATSEDIKKLGPVFAEMANGLEKLNPPADVRAYHEALVKALHASSDQLAAYRRGAGDPFAPVERWYLPAKTGQRLQAIAAKNPDCTKASFRFDSTYPFGAD